MINPNNYTELEHYKIVKLKELTIEIATTTWGLTEDEAYSLMGEISKVTTAAIEKTKCPTCGKKREEV